MYIRNKINNDVHVVDELVDGNYISYSCNPDGTTTNVYYVANDYIEFFEE